MEKFSAVISLTNCFGQVSQICSCCFVFKTKKYSLFSRVCLLKYFIVLPTTHIHSQVLGIIPELSLTRNHFLFA